MATSIVHGNNIIMGEHTRSYLRLLFGDNAIVVSGFTMVLLHQYNFRVCVRTHKIILSSI